ncbi:hypothetical protein [Paenibacillus sp. Soil787]|uniref:hypothetical protein n=1 Tax=Paenibacillus sp. Soil787 TaxID=1736411 RepID=UPI000703943F|nr:hypothetical protein [Paenibacillus sp. Soil787]KRF20209.1 GCN5 family acetyltransferase [Paenibacillus sp. Soil787]
MISLKKITLENRRAMFNMEVSEEQRHYVASNLSSVASCYVLLTNGGHPFPFVIYADEQPVGFVMLAYGITGYEEPSIAGRAQYCWIPYKSDNVVAKRLYESFGFRDNGEVFNNESITVLRL